MQLHHRVRRLSSTLLRFRCPADLQHWGGLSGRPTPTAGATSTLPVCRFTLEPLKVSDIGLVCHGTLNCGGANRHLRPGLGPGEGDARGVVGMTWFAVDGAPNWGSVWSRSNAGQGSLSRSKHQPRRKPQVRCQRKSVVLATWLRSEGRLPDLRTIATVTGSQSFTLLLRAASVLGDSAAALADDYFLSRYACGRDRLRLQSQIRNDRACSETGSARPSGRIGTLRIHRQLSPKPRGRLNEIGRIEVLESGFSLHLADAIRISHQTSIGRIRVLTRKYRRPLPMGTLPIR